MEAVIKQQDHHAVIFDLDGVITKTAVVHARAWKKMFDGFLQQYSSERGLNFVPFDQTSDYLQYVDGKPRYEGIRSFLCSRGIDIPIGEVSDSGEKSTICGLGNRKNQMFLEELQKGGVEVYNSSVNLIKKLRAAGIKTALISSSKNCVPIIEKVGAKDLFDVIIDGVIAEKRKIRGKPHPDIFLAAAEILGTEPKHAVVIEDAISGVQAGKAGDFSLVIGVDRQNQADDLLKEGADVVVRDLKEITFIANSSPPPNALLNFERITRIIGDRKLALFLDYDGTLTPIVAHPDMAKLDNSMRNVLRDLARNCIVAIISGRNREEIIKLVDIENIFYAGNHGFDISGPDDIRFEIEEGVARLPELEEVEHRLRDVVPTIPGAWVERKKFTIAVHFRQTSPEKESDIEKIVAEIQSSHPALKAGRGKKIWELRPNIPWDKGRALIWLLKLLELDKDNALPIYIGDDICDEDAFRVVADYGIGIAILSDPRPTFAGFSLSNWQEVREFLTRLSETNG